MTAILIKSMISSQCICMPVRERELELNSVKYIGALPPRFSEWGGQLPPSPPGSHGPVMICKALLRDIIILQVIVGLVKIISGTTSKQITCV